MHHLKSLLVAIGTMFGLAVFIAVVSALVGVIAPAFADTVTGSASGSVSIPWGDFLAAGLEWARGILVAVLLGVTSIGLHKFLPNAAGAVNMVQVEQLIGRAVDYGITATEGATKGRVVAIPIANAVLEAAADYAIAAAPTLAGKVGDMLRPKIIARLGEAGLVPADASVVMTQDGATLAAPAPDAAKAA